MQKENLLEGVLFGVFLSLAIGIVISWILRPTLPSIVFILSLALLPGFFIMTLLHVYKLSREKLARGRGTERFDWGTDTNLRRLQIIHTRYASLIQTAGLLATGALLAMSYLASNFPRWTTGEMIFFPITTAMFIFFLHLVFRWWFLMRKDYPHLQFQRTKA